MRIPNEPERVTVTLVGLWIYPIKSCAGVAVASAELDAQGGLKGDREWVLVDAKGELVWQGGIPRMALVRPVPSADGLCLHAPDALPLRVDGRATGEECAVKIWNTASRTFDTFGGTDSGPRAQAWLTAVLDQPLRLVRLGDAARRRHALNPLHLLGLPSLRRLNDRLTQKGHPPVALERFRPNLVIDGVDGSLAAFAEESFAAVCWPRADGALRLAIATPCVRCVMPNIDLHDARVGKEPLATLATMSAERASRAPVCFGVYGRGQQGGSIARGEQGWANDRE